MPVNLSIKNAPDDIVERLRERAARNHRSLQGELMAIIETAVSPPETSGPMAVLAEIRKLNLRAADVCTLIVREDRNR